MKGPFRLLLGVVLVAVSAAAFAIAFRASLTWLYLRLYGAGNVVDAITKLPGWLRLGVPIAAAAVAGTIARFRSPGVQNVSNVMEAVALGRVQLSMRVTTSRVASSWAAIAGGMSIGREGPLIEMGGALGAAIGRRLGTPLTDTRVLVAAGTAAGFAAAYNTPFAASLFVLETIAGVVAPSLLMPVMAATVAASMVTRTIAGDGPIYGQRAFAIGSYGELISFAALGAAAAVAAIGFKRVLSAFEAWFERLPLGQPWRAMMGGAIVGVIAMGLPAVAGNGYEPVNHLLDTPLPVAMLLVLIASKVVATSGSVACGVPGGVFTPMLLVGAALGGCWSALMAATGLLAFNPGSYALVGMAAATAASIHAPLTAAVMIFELSGDYPIVLPLMLTTVAATACSRALNSESVYEAELRKRGLGWELTLEGRQVRPPGPES
jgi:CIC family chloride channel protein